MVSFGGRKVLVTGGTGSFGHQIVNRLTTLQPELIRVLSRDEEKQYRMRQEFEGATNLEFLLGDVRDRRTVEEAVRGMDVVIHAAALKQVPNCEFFPLEAIRTNVLGANNVFEACRAAGVDRVVTISTDKAVKPINAMGLTKALQEKMLIAAAAREGERGGTRLTIVRYGNVLGSRASVVPLFRECMRAGKPLPLTDPKMTRFLLSLDEAVDLVFLALDGGQSGHVFVRKMPAATVEEIAAAVVRHYEPSLPMEQVRARFRVVGIRPGEKMAEVLVTADEMRSAVDRGDYFEITPPLIGGLHTARRVQPSLLNTEGEYTSDSTWRLTASELDAMLVRARCLDLRPSALVDPEGPMASSRAFAAT